MQKFTYSILTDVNYGKKDSINNCLIARIINIIIQKLLIPNFILNCILN